MSACQDHIRRAIDDKSHHLFGRGIERRAIISTDPDREHYLELLDGMSQRYCVRIHAYAQMATHYLERLRDAVAIGSAAFAEWCGMTLARPAGWPGTCSIPPSVRPFGVLSYRPPLMRKIDLKCPG